MTAPIIISAIVSVGTLAAQMVCYKKSIKRKP